MGQGPVGPGRSFVHDHTQMYQVIMRFAENNRILIVQSVYATARRDTYNISDFEKCARLVDTIEKLDFFFLINSLKVKNKKIIPFEKKNNLHCFSHNSLEHNIILIASCRDDYTVCNGFSIVRGIIARLLRGRFE